MEPKELEEALLVDGAIVIECDAALSHETMNRYRDYLRTIWPERKVLILDAGQRLARNHEPQLARIERKLDLLIQALAEDEEEEPAIGMDGKPLPRERAGNEEL